MLLKEVLNPIQQVRHQVLSHGGARTQALYRWENEEFYDTPAGRRKLSVEQLRALGTKIWAREGWDALRPCPEITIENQPDNLSYSQGRSRLS